jgi:hypothetical protein
MSGLACSVARLGEDLEVPRLMRHHRTGCLHCQVRSARAQRLRRDLGALRKGAVPAPPGLAPRVMSQIGERTSPQVCSGPKLSHRLTAAAGAVVASAAGAAAFALWRRSHSAA